MKSNKIIPRHNKARTMRMSNRGLTLIELVIVSIIIAILAVIAVPKYDKAVEDSRTAEAKNTLGNIRESLIRYAEQNNDAYPTNIVQLDISTPAAGKFYNFELVTNPQPNYLDTNDQVIAKAIRNGLKVGGGYNPNYYVEIYESGKLMAGAPGGGHPVVIGVIGIGNQAIGAGNEVIGVGIENGDIVIDDPVGGQNQLGEDQAGNL